MNQDNLCAACSQIPLLFTLRCSSCIVGTEMAGPRNNFTITVIIKELQSPLLSAQVAKFAVGILRCHGQHLYGAMEVSQIKVCFCFQWIAKRSISAIVQSKLSAIIEIMQSISVRVNYRLWIR